MSEMVVVDTRDAWRRKVVERENGARIRLS